MMSICATWPPSCATPVHLLIADVLTGTRPAFTNTKMKRKLSQSDSSESQEPNSKAARSSAHQEHKSGAKYRQFAKPVQQIIAGCATHSEAYKRLEEMCTRFGNRIAGSTTLERCLDWCLAGMK